MSGTIIDTLITVFKADSKDLKQAFSDADNGSQKTTASMTAAEKASQHLGEQFSDLAKHAAGAVAALFAVHHVIEEMTVAAEAALDLKHLSDETGASMESISAWGHAAVEAGGSVEAFQASAKNLGKGIQDLAINGDGQLLPFMNYLGVSFLDGAHKARDLSSVLLDLSDRFEHMDKRKGVNIGEQMGLDAGTISLLQKGRVAVEEVLRRKKELGSLDKQNAETAIMFNVAMDESKARLEHIYMAVGSFVLPAFSKMLDVFGAVVDFFHEHSDFMQALFIGIGAAIMTVMVPSLWAMAAALYANPLTWFVAGIMAAVAAIALLYDDIQNFLDGNESVIGHILEGWRSFEEAVAGIFDDLGAALQDFVDTYLPFINDILGGIDKIQGLGIKAVNFITGASDMPLNSQDTTTINGGTSNSTTNNINASATINTQASDAASVSKVVGSTFGDQLRSAVSQHDDGVRA